MKIEIDLQEILSDEFGDSETLAESIKRQIVSDIQVTMKGKISKVIDKEVATMIGEEVKRSAEKVAKDLASNLIDYEYRPVGRYGDREGPTTMRKEFIKVLTDQMVYKPKRYDSEKSAFTKSVDSIVAEELKTFKADYKTKVDELFTKEALDFAVFKMKEKLGITA